MLNLFVVDVSNLRRDRQKLNNQIVSNLLYQKKSLDEIKKQINPMALDRLLKEENMTYDLLINKCQDDFICRSVARNISINSSRQGKIDEKLIIDGVATFMEPYGYKIRGCGVKEIRFCKDGRVLDAEQFKKEKLDKNKDSLKSVDGIIEGKINGYIFAKVVIGGGGHQDNVLTESLTYINWIKQFGQKDKTYVLLIDGEDLKTLKEYETDNIWIVNHLEFQMKLIEKSKEN